MQTFNYIFLGHILLFNAFLFNMIFSEIRTDQVYNISEALDLENISGLSKPHVLKIIREEGKPTIFLEEMVDRSGMCSD